MIPGEYHYASDDPIDYNKGYEAIEIEVKNSGDRAVQLALISISMKPTAV